jgi:hypothetical protein
MATVGPFQRWYDADATLSEMIQVLESLSQPSQTLFALLITHFSNGIVRARGHAFYTQLHWRKLYGLLQSRRSRRWYDKEALLHKSFNKLYSLSDADKSLIARELRVPLQLVRDYEATCSDQNTMPELDQICGIVEGCFTGNQNRQCRAGNN